VRPVDTYGHAGLGTCVGVSIGLLLGFLIGELAWSTIICTAIGSILGQLKDFQIQSPKVLNPINIED
jgi:uncharacterized membrane protein